MNHEDGMRFLRSQGAVVDLKAVVALCFPTSRGPAFEVTMFGGGTVSWSVDIRAGAHADYESGCRDAESQLSALIECWKSVRA